jgi:hypothetical protein
MNSKLSDLEKAELHLQSKFPGALLWGTLLLLWSATSFAAAPGKIYYSAIFHTQGNPTPWRLVIMHENRLPVFNTKKPSKKRLFAQIETAGTPWVNCDLQHLEKDKRGKPLALEMSCKNIELESFTTTATVLWNHAGKSATLRFGTWLQGYQQMPLTVETDGYSRKPIRRLVATVR